MLDEQHQPWLERHPHLQSEGIGEQYGALLSGLQRGQVHLFAVTSAEAPPAFLMRRYQNLLTPQEADRMRRFHFERDRNTYLITRALVRTTLSLYATEIDPVQWEFECNRYGRPAIHARHSIPWLRFNISHTAGAIVLAVAHNREVGVDVEHAIRGGSMDEIASQSFSPAEVAAMRALPEHDRPTRFFVYWTLKEAYIKARGMGLSLPLDQFAFHVEEDPIRISFAPSMHDNPVRWHFQIHCLTPCHPVALAIERRAEERPELVHWRTVPLSRRTPDALQDYP